MSPQAVSSQSNPGISVQSLHSSSYPPCVPGNWILSRNCIVLRQGWSLWFSLHLECYRSTAALSNSLKCFSSVPNNCPVVGSWPLFQFPHTPRSESSPAHSSFPAPFLCPTSCGLKYSFPVVRDSCLSSVVLQDLLHIRYILDASVERDAVHIHLLLHHLSSQQCFLNDLSLSAENK